MRWIIGLLIAIAPAQSVGAQAPDRMSYVLFAGNGNSSMGSGNMDDLSRARALRSGNAPMLYVRQDGATYVIRDPATLRRAEAIMAPQQEVGRRQGKLGEQQGELGRRQGILGAEQGRLGAQMADARVRELGALGEQQAALGRRQAELGKQQAALGARQAALGQEQARLAAQAMPLFRALVDEAIRRGVAQRVN